MSKPIIALDIDDVLSNSVETFLAYSNKTWNHQHTPEDFTEHVASMWQVSAEEANQRWMEYLSTGSLAQLAVIPGAKEVLIELKKRYTIYAVSSRRDFLYNLTKSWLEQNYPGITDGLYLTGFYGKSINDAHLLTKATLLQEIHADYLIDDQPKHCFAAAEVGISAVLYGDYPWQKYIELPHNVTHCKNWQDVAQFFDGHK
jgi:5'(3')-deoxyribonucleotidase